jgi:hypothetical protein
MHEVTAPPLPASPCLRVKLDYSASDDYLGGSRFYLSYAGSAPTAGNCITIAGDIEAAWLAHLAAAVDTDWSLTEVDVLDIASDDGLSGQWTGDEAGTNTGTSLPQQCAINVEFNIARRYRGGKPRMYLPPGVSADLANLSHWTDDFITDVNTAVAAFFTAVEAIDVGSVGALAHVNLSYYKGFTNITNSSGRTRAVPSYRTSALLDTVESYATKAVVSSQKRRRTATTY